MITFTTNPYRGASASTDGWTRATTDEIGRVERVETFSGGPTSPPPDEGTNANSTGSVVTTYNGEQTTVRDQANKQRRSTVDGLGRLVKVEELYETGALYATTNYTYDVLGNLTSVAQGSQTRTFTYDSLSRLKSATNPESGTIAYNYDDNSNLTSKIDARSITTSYVYDSLNRVTSRSYSDGTPAVTYTYDAIGVANSKGRLTQVSSSVSSYSYDGYDAEGKLTQSTQMTDGQAYLMNYAYNLAGAMTKETYPSGRVVTTNYDSAGRLSSVVGVKDSVTTTYTSQYSYSAHGAALSFKLGNNLWEHTNFNSRLQPTQIGLGATSATSGTLELNYTYGTSNNNGNILTQQIIAPNLNTTQSYTYDQVNRLLVAQENSGSNWKQTFSYDVYGNRRFDAANTTANVLGPNPTISATNNRINASGYIYDSAGNMTAEPGKSYAYDGENRQKSYNVTGASYHYDGDGRRVKKVVGTVTTLFVYNAVGQMIAEYESPSPSSSGGTSYLTTDHLGSTRVVTDSAGLVKTRRDYLPFGEEIAASIGGRTAAGGYGQADGIDQKFTGYERDGESGLDFAQARYYSSVQGRFTSVDPALTSGRAESPQTWNRYSYTLNNPLIYIDPDGRDVILIIWATHDGHIGHAGIAVSNYKEEQVMEDGHLVTRMVPDGTYTYRDLWPAEAVGKSNYDQDVPAFYGNDRVTLDQLLNTDVTGSEGYAPDGAIRLQTDHSTDQAVLGALSEFQDRNPNYNGLGCNCSDFPEHGIEVAAGRQLPVDEVVRQEQRFKPGLGMIPEPITATTPNQLFKAVRDLPKATVIKDPGDKVNRRFVQGVKEGKKR